jgi:carbonic anhydrase/acetyltransferase-like protein (isoleucine patch superfamily)
MQTDFRVLTNERHWNSISYEDVSDLKHKLMSEHKIIIGDNFHMDEMYGIFLEDNIKIGKNVRFKDTSRADRASIHISSGTVIGDECTIYHDVFIGENVKLGEGVTINSGSKISKNVSIDYCSNIGIGCKIKIGSIIGSVVNIDSCCLIVGSNIANFCNIENGVKIFNSTIERGVFIGAYTIINNLSHINENVIIGSSLIIPEFSEIKTSLYITLSNGDKIFWNPITGLRIGNRTESVEWWEHNIEKRIAYIHNLDIIEAKRLINAVKHFQDPKLNKSEIG